MKTNLAITSNEFHKVFSVSNWFIFRFLYILSNDILRDVKTNKL